MNRPRRQTEWGPGIIGQGQVGHLGDAPAGKYRGYLYVPDPTSRSGWDKYHVYDEASRNERAPGFRR